MESTAFGLGAVVLPLLVVPTLKELEGTEPRRAWTLPITKQNVYDKLIFSKSKAKQRWWTYITYGFVHKDLDHLMSNLITFIPSALSVQRNFGTVIMWSTFLGGIATGAGPLELSVLKDIQHERNIKSVLVPSSSAISNTGAASLWNDGVDWGAKKVAPIIGYYAEYVGCSSGCFALLGLDLCNSLETLWSAIFGDSSYNQYAAARNDEDVDRVVLGISSHVMSCYFAGQLMLEQWKAFSTNGFQGLSQTDHAGHLLGMGFGAFCYLTIRTGQWLFRPRYVNKR